MSLKDGEQINKVWSRITEFSPDAARTHAPTHVPVFKLCSSYKLSITW
jgi:hypothetical protein